MQDVTDPSASPQLGSPTQSPVTTEPEKEPELEPWLAPPPGTARYQFHPLARLFPPMGEAAFKTFVEDLRVNGQKEPILTFEGMIVDGRHRYLACLRLGVEPIVREWDGSGSLLDVVVSANVMRRHLKENQRAMVAARLLPQYEAEVEKKEHDRKTGRTGLNLDQSSRSAEVSGKTLNVSRASVHLAKRVLTLGIPNLIARVEQGALAVSVAAKIAELPREEQSRLLALPRGEMAKALRPAQSAQAPDPSRSLEERHLPTLQHLVWSGVKLTQCDEGLRLDLISDAYLKHLGMDLKLHERVKALLYLGVYLEIKLGQKGE